MKTCTYCHARKPLDQFGLVKNGTNVRPTSLCRECANEAVRRHYAKRRQQGIGRRHSIGERYAQFRIAARKREIPFELTREEFATFWQQPCSYCGDPIAHVGLDRVDNSLGYVSGNVVACCGTCNRMKLALTVDQFWAHIKKLAARQPTG